MEGDKRKSEANGSVLGGSQKRAREETTVTDEEVDEFYAILRRIHVAINYFKKDNSDMRNVTVLRKVESMDFGAKVELNGGEEKKAEENMVLDLNADPGTASDPF